MIDIASGSMGDNHILKNILEHSLEVPALDLLNYSTETPWSGGVTRKG